MVWTPEFTVIDATTIGENLLAYIMTNQRDALDWAGGTTLKLLQPVSIKVTDPTVPMLPSIGIENETEEPVDDNGDVIDTIYSVTFEIWTEDSAPEAVIANAKRYKKALVSMVQECPTSTLLSGTGSVQIPDRLRPAIDFPAVRSFENEMHFFQNFQIRASFKVSAGLWQ